MLNEDFSRGIVPNGPVLAVGGESAACEYDVLVRMRLASTTQVYIDSRGPVYLNKHQVKCLVDLLAKCLDHMED